jgi:hypothetical protein
VWYASIRPIVSLETIDVLRLRPSYMLTHLIEEKDGCFFRAQLSYKIAQIRYRYFMERFKLYMYPQVQVL